MGLSPKLSTAEQGAQVGYYWEQLPEPRPAISLEIVLENQKDVVFFNLGPHPPRLWPEDIELAHTLWLKLSSKGFGSKLHHRDVVGVALRRMAADLESERSPEVLEDVKKEVATGTASQGRIVAANRCQRLRPQPLGGKALQLDAVANRPKWTATPISMERRRRLSLRYQVHRDLRHQFGIAVTLRFPARKYRRSMRMPSFSSKLSKSRTVRK